MNDEQNALAMVWEFRFRTLKFLEFGLSRLFFIFWVDEVVIPNGYHFLFNLPFPSSFIQT
jgi:hypothetical protein